MLYIFTKSFSWIYLSLEINMPCLMTSPSSNLILKMEYLRLKTGFTKSNFERIYRWHTMAKRNSRASIFSQLSLPCGTN